MPQFSLRMLLGLTALIALWCASFTMDIRSDVQDTFELMIVVAAGAGAIHYRGSWQAFWMGFLFVYLVLYCPPLMRFFVNCYPQFTAIGRISSKFGAPDGVSGTLEFVEKIATCCLGGYISSSIFKRAHRPPPMKDAT